MPAPEPQPGTPLSASLLSSLIALATGRWLEFQFPLQLVTLGGRSVVRMAPHQRFTAAITGGSNPYTWTSEDGTLNSAHDPAGQAHEANGNASVPSGTKVELIRQPSGDLLFWFAVC